MKGVSSSYETKKSATLILILRQAAIEQQKDSLWHPWPRPWLKLFLVHQRRLSFQTNCNQIHEDHLDTTGTTGKTRATSTSSGSNLGKSFLSIQNIDVQKNLLLNQILDELLYIIIITNFRARMWVHFLTFCFCFFKLNLARSARISLKGSIMFNSVLRRLDNLWIRTIGCTCLCIAQHHVVGAWSKPPWGTLPRFAEFTDIRTAYIVETFGHSAKTHNPWHTRRHCSRQSWQHAKLKDVWSLNNMSKAFCSLTKQIPMNTRSFWFSFAGWGSWFC